MDRALVNTGYTVDIPWIFSIYHITPIVEFTAWKLRLGDNFWQEFSAANSCVCLLPGL